MTPRTPLALLLAAALGCAGAPVAERPQGYRVAPDARIVETVIEEIPGPRPEWVDVIPESTPDALYFVGQSGFLSQERDARNDALRDAVNAFARYCGVDVNLVDEYLAVSVAKASGIQDPTVSRKIHGVQATDAFVSRLKGRQWYTRRIERSMGSTVLERGWQAWVLARVPPDEVERVREYRDRQRVAELEAEMAPYVELYARATQLLEAARSARGEGHPLEALATYQDALQLYDRVVEMDGFARARPYLAARDYEVPLPVRAELQDLLSDLAVEALTPSQRILPGEPLPEALAVRVTDAGRAVSGAPVRLSWQTGELLLTTAVDGSAAYHPAGTEQWPPGNRIYQAELVHPALERAAAAFAVPGPATLTVAVRPLDDTELRAYNRAALEAFAAALAGGAPAGNQVTVLPATETDGRTRLGRMVADSIADALTRHLGWQVVDADQLLAGGDPATRQAGSVVASRLAVTDEKIQLRGRLVELPGATVAATAEATLRLTPTWRRAWGEPSPTAPAVQLTTRFRYQIPNALPRPLEPGMQLRAGNMYSAYFEPQQTAYVYAYQRDSDGEIYALFPNPDLTDIGNPVQAGTGVWLPSEQWSFEVEEQAGDTELVIVASRLPLAEMDEVFRTLQDSQRMVELTEGGDARARREVLTSAPPEIVDVATEILANPALGTVERVKFRHR